MGVGTCALLVASLAASVVSATWNPVCIVGAGPAGLSAAKALEAKGEKVVLFEKQALAGGKCQAYYDQNGDWHPLGAVIFTHDTYEKTREIFEQTTVPVGDFTHGPRWLFDWKKGTVSQPTPSPPDLLAALLGEVTSYATFWMSQYGPEVNVIGYKNGVPAELAVSGAEWLAANGYIYLGILISDLISTYGYGDYRVIPMVYIMKFVTPEVLRSSLGLEPGFITDFHKQFVEYSKLIDGPIHYETDIKLISRLLLPAILYKRPGDWLPKLQLCSKIVLAFPPTLSALRDANLVISREESDLFKDVLVQQYYSSVVRAEHVPNGPSFWAAKENSLIPVEPEGQPIYFKNLHAASGLVDVWSWDADSAVGEDEKVRRILAETLSKFNKDPASDEEPTPVSDRDIVAFNHVEDYFPHVGPEPLTNGWYDRYDLQGKHHTYYASGLSGFEIVEHAVRAGQDIANYF